MPSFLLRLRPLAAAAIVTAAGLSACGPTSDATDGPRIVAAFYPLQYVAERVAGPEATVENLTQPGKEPHDLQLSVRQVAEVATADLVVFEGGFQAAVDAAVKDREGQSVDASQAVELHAPTTGHDGETAEEHAGHTDEGHEHGDLDPHFWQDPLLLADFGDAVAEALTEVDPDHAADFTANAAALRSDLEQLDGEFRTGLQGCERDTVVVSHDAFGYLTKYGLHLEPIVGLSPDAEPTAAGIAALHEVIEKDGITTVFSETLASPRIAEAIAGDLDITTAVLDPLEGLTAEAEENGGDYLSVMRQNLAALKKANAC